MSISSPVDFHNVCFQKLHSLSQLSNILVWSCSCDSLMIFEYLLLLVRCLFSYLVLFISASPQNQSCPSLSNYFSETISFSFCWSLDQSSILDTTHKSNFFGNWNPLLKTQQGLTGSLPRSDLLNYVTSSSLRTKPVCTPLWGQQIPSRPQNVSSFHALYLRTHFSFFFHYSRGQSL